jgi:hypothetical protein
VPSRINRATQHPRSLLRHSHRDATNAATKTRLRQAAGRLTIDLDDFMATSGQIGIISPVGINPRRRSAHDIAPHNSNLN